MSGAVVLADLAQQINAEHAAAVEHANGAVESARRAGELLILAKESLDHGDWQDWLRANVTVTPRMAQQYMRLARELPKLAEEKRNAVSHLPVRYAIAQLARAAPALEKMNPQELQQVVEIGESGERLSKAVSTVNHEQRRAEQESQAAEHAKRKRADGTLTEYDLWTTAGELYTSKALDIETAGSPPDHVLKLTQWHLLPSLPGEIAAAIPQKIYGEMQSRQKVMQQELKRRIHELAQWAEEQRAHIAAPLREAIDTADPILIGRKTIIGSNTDSEINLMDMRNMNVRCWATKHSAEGCRCEDELPLGCVHGRSLSAAAVGDTWRRCISCGEVLRHLNYNGAGDTCSYCLDDREGWLQELERRRAAGVCS